MGVIFHYRGGTALNSGHNGHTVYDPRSSSVRYLGVGGWEPPGPKEKTSLPVFQLSTGSSQWKKNCFPSACIEMCKG